MASVNGVSFDRVKFNNDPKDEVDFESKLLIDGKEVGVFKMYRAGNFGLGLKDKESIDLIKSRIENASLPEEDGVSKDLLFFEELELLTLLHEQYLVSLRQGHTHLFYLDGCEVGGKVARAESSDDENYVNHLLEKYKPEIWRVFSSASDFVR